ncbi:class I SAM-dependent methyltransferase [Mycolicibacterium murale]|nr:class I SAM-dependent methyltransferase [Mycolicibacterium murale]MCV7182236.1 class I SAM-dependent methyltransferase [Mycolicibacterium murale]
MNYMSRVEIESMPRGGPDASCLDRLLETDRLEYLDRDDIDDAVKRRVIGALDWTGRVFGNHRRFAEIALAEVAEVADPAILELGAGHGAVSALLLENHPTARLTVTDLNAESVAAMAHLADDPRVSVRQMDATAIDAPDGAFDLALFALSFHHLAPPQAAQVFAEGTRVATKLVIIDLPRPPAPLHLMRLASMLPWAPVHPFVHDGVISSLRSYSPSALRALAAHADPNIEVTLRGGITSPQVVVAHRV